MPDPPSTRQCEHCRHSRQIGERLCCIRNAPTADPNTAQARWPIVHPTDYCARFHPNTNQKSKIKNQKSDAPAATAAPIPNQTSSASASNRQSQITNDESQIALPICVDALGPYCKIPLTQGRFAKVDPADYVWLSQFRWCVKVGLDACYAVRTVQVRGKSKRIFMHRQIMNTPPHLVCDHENHDGLDNRRRNLRNCNYSQNNANRRKRPHATSPYLGVSWDSRRQKWTAHIRILGTAYLISGAIRGAESVLVNAVGHLSGAAGQPLGFTVYGS
jgi:hypothetical protein